MIYESFKKNVLSSPHKTAIVYRNIVYSYEILDENVLKMVAWCQANSIEKGSKVLIVLNNSPFMTICFLAFARVGAVLVPIPVDQGAVSRKAMLSYYDYDLLVTEDRLLSTCNAEFPGLLVLSPGIFKTSVFKVDSNQNSTNLSDNPYIFTMTSGSTGNPKPIILTQEIKLKRIHEGAIEAYRLQQDEVVLVASPMYHSLGMRLALLPLMLGGTSVILHQFSPKSWLSAVQEHHVTFTISVSDHLRKILPLSVNYELSSLRQIVSSSSLLSLEDKKMLLARLSCRLHECYGTSEIGIATSFDLLSSPERIGSVGKPLNHVRVAIFNECGKSLPASEVGEICCATETMFHGYEGHTENTIQAFYGDYFRTGDLGYLDVEGFLFLKGRLKEIIKVSGVSVYPEDIERVILMYPNVVACMCVGLDDPLTGEVPAVAFIAMNTAFDLSELIRFCHENLDSVQVPKHWRSVTQLPKTSLGKPQRSLLRAEWSLL